ncbi:hypothetical protein NQ314_013867 [Rhamnusium bicolor]|uniref:DDE-1 domain-containing protein n=1 Tax=Rhamnusium bicolor TaxID=1586634 RepID=A0AAV8X4P7_9CUCU|nr:hypothetical protein NQ314_013867 [Rhamnusium bicolor]
MPVKPRVITEQEEESFAGHLIALSALGFPVTGEDLKIIVKSYLNRQGRNVSCFRNNYPGPDWVNFFLRRMPELSQRFSQNISHSRAVTDEGTINHYLDNLQTELEAVPPANIWNYDDTNLVDDPGCSKVITRKGTKYPERICISSKACTSLMICGNAEGRLAPVYVNYKSQKLCGWFDFQVFEGWFINLILPLLNRQEGCKMLNGDNLTSHLNVEMIRQCELNNVRFIALPPNTTHLLQPLDVTYFRPMKGNWRQILNDWKNTAKGSRFSGVPKDIFPRLLKTLLTTGRRGAENLKSGFRKCGICPLNRKVVLNRLCGNVVTDDPIIEKVVGESFLGHLSQKRQEATTSRIRRKKKLEVPPGKGITVSDVQNQVSTEPVDYSQPSTSGIQNISIQEESSNSSDSNKSLPLTKNQYKRPKGERKFQIVQKIALTTYNMQKVIIALSTLNFQIIPV